MISNRVRGFSLFRSLSEGRPRVFSKTVLDLKGFDMDFTALATAASTAITAALTAVVPVVAVVVGASVGYKLFRKFVG